MQLTQQPTKILSDLDIGDGKKFVGYTIELTRPDGARVAQIIAYEGYECDYPRLKSQQEAEDAAAYIMRAVEVYGIVLATIAANQSKEVAK